MLSPLHALYFMLPNGWDAVPTSKVVEGLPKDALVDHRIAKPRRGVKVSGTFSDVNIAAADSPTSGVPPYRLLRPTPPQAGAPSCLAKSLNTF